MFFEQNRIEEYIDFTNQDYFDTPQIPNHFQISQPDSDPEPNDYPLDQMLFIDLLPPGTIHVKHSGYEKHILGLAFMIPE